MAVKRKKMESYNSSGKRGEANEKKQKKKEASPSPPTPPLRERDDGTPVRAIACLKMHHDMKRFEETDDCFILGFDPYKPVSLSQDDGVDISVVAEKGQVACRDYPHSRHLCIKFPFKTTSHEKHCELCYCYVCDITAPCKYWRTTEGHCHAENTTVWRDVRLGMRHSKRNSERSNGIPLSGRM
ncbi:hypothetical protein HN51_032018 [Arachis hypogaea]|nr:RPM1 interacting protein 13 [Arachis duranensis]XP_025623317.1 uncharacterized protein LOC112715721 [Arachis hypogaea]RYR34170.1 hypothetical protein Ahy_A10g048906 isoform B [Arachis hypogaea]